MRWLLGFHKILEDDVDHKNEDDQAEDVDSGEEQELPEKPEKIRRRMIGIVLRSG